MKFATESLVALLAVFSIARGAEAIKLSRKQTTITQGGITLTTRNGQTKTFELRAGDLSAGKYKYVVTVNNGTIYDMTVLDSTRTVYADTAPGWGWSSLYNPNEIDFTLGKAAKAVTFLASTESQKVDLDYKLATAN
ncbi:hypothetical protein M409DRAFT_25408 [Zasmidium cellare ATCC 36951]|uniref:Uncharacterized protein n=1 Tax=Zasmidium cellare ATCC 36951 TaxID=1080233 RepID=A0A6A6CCX8_ZASCE|nr:uncharacterized protein M409DRAFT_25408 [Zasmidium cellare ATCC 36951]KAF2164060.1 hypothetical protein M409DRAFT_25408 [Zasmidium cellare ATCC 36951]